MKNNSLLFLMLLPAFSLFSQNYMISFSGSGETTVIDSVIVYNFQQNISLTLQGNDTLHLVENLGIGQPSRHKPINIYPNPTANSSRLELFCYRAEKAVLQVYNTSGILIYQEGLLVEQGDNTFTLEGLRQGNYLIRINSPSEEYSGQLIAAGSGSGPVKLTKNSTVSFKSLPTDDKNAGSIIQMLYHSGERILLKSFAGPYIHIKSIIPAGNELVNFEIIPCVDGDGNYYPVTTIGTQLWMAEYLKTTSFTDGSPLTLITDNTTWVDYSLPAYCWFNNDEITYKQSMGGIYNWYAASSSNICPVGWHVPTDEDWKILEGTVDTQFGVGHTEWNKSSWRGFDAGCNLRARGIWTQSLPGCETDYFGFSAIPTGGRSYISGTFGTGTNWNYIWASDDIDELNGIARHLHSSYHGVRRTNQAKAEGASARCVKYIDNRKN